MISQRIVRMHVNKVLEILDNSDLSKDEAAFENWLREMTALLAVAGNVVLEGLSQHENCSAASWRLLISLSEVDAGLAEFGKSFATSLGVSIETDREELKSLEKKLSGLSISAQQSDQLKSFIVMYEMHYNEAFEAH